MQKKNVLGLVLAASFAMSALVGCNAPAQVGVPGSTHAGQPSANDAREGTAAALAEERAMDDYDFMAGQEANANAYAVMMVGQPRPKEGEVAITSETAASAETKPDADARPTRPERPEQRGEAFKGKLPAEVQAKLKARMAKKAETIKGRLEKQKEAREKIRNAAKGGQWVDNGDGTETKRFSFDVEVQANGRGASRSVEMSRTRNIETKDLVKSEVTFSLTNPAGMTKTSTRTKTLNADGSYTVVFHSEHVFKDGRKRVADWEKTIGVDGNVSGSGTITWFDASGAEVKKATVNLAGTEEEATASAEGQAVAPEETEAEASPSPEAEASEPTEAEDATPEAEASEEPASPEETASV